MRVRVFDSGKANLSRGQICTAPGIDVRWHVPGRYLCRYTAVRAGTYEVLVYVGGQSGEREAISGLDPASISSSTSSSSEDNANTNSNSNNNQASAFHLEVEPGVTDRRATLCFGAALTLATVGVRGEFQITARDAFSNRRPGTSPARLLYSCYETSGTPYVIAMR